MYEFLVLFFLLLAASSYLLATNTAGRLAMAGLALLAAVGAAVGALCSSLALAMSCGGPHPFFYLILPASMTMGGLWLSRLARA